MLSQISIFDGRQVTKSPKPNLDNSEIAQFSVRFTKCKACRTTLLAWCDCDRSIFGAHGCRVTFRRCKSTELRLLVSLACLPRPRSCVFLPQPSFPARVSRAGVGFSYAFPGLCRRKRSTNTPLAPLERAKIRRN